MNESTHPSPEVLAAFVDGRLAGDARAEVVAHLDHCRDCYEVFAGTVRFQRQEEPRGRVLRPARFGAPQWVWWTAAAAAVLVVAIVVPVVWEDLGLGGRDGDGGVLLASVELASALGPAGAGSSASAWEGWGDGRAFASFSQDRVSFRVGVRLMDLAAAAQAGELAGESQALDDLVGLLRDAGVDGEFDADLRAARDALDDRDARGLSRSIAELEAGSELELDPFHLAFGKWAEAGRLAAESGAPELFQSLAFSDFHQRLTERGLRGPVAEALREIDEILRGGAEPARELDELAARFETLIGRAG